MKNEDLKMKIRNRRGSNLFQLNNDQKKKINENKKTYKKTNKNY